MIKVQVQRPCSKTNVREGQNGFISCLECKVGGYKTEPFTHGTVTEWMSLEKAVQMAHEEAVANDD